MKNTSNFQIELDGIFFTKDPFSSSLGKNIILNSILLIDELGFEAFTIKKLADRIHTTEACIYRYFEDKSALMTYHLTWYWSWMDYRLSIATANINSPAERLKVALQLLTSPLEQEPGVPQVDEAALYRIVVSESQKLFLTKSVDKENKQGLFFSYKRLCKKVAGIVSEINAEYRYPAALISSIIESSHDQRYFAQNLPALTEIPRGHEKVIAEFLTELVFKTIKKDCQVNYTPI